MTENKQQQLERRKIKTNYKGGTLQYLFEDIYTYNQDNPLLPCGYFWSYLSKSNHGPQIWVPDTFVMSQPQTPSVWIYSNQNGTTQKSSYKSLKDFATKLCESQEYGNVVAICKKPIFRNDGIIGNDIKIIRNHGVTAFMSQMPANLSGAFVIQRFIKCSGHKPFVCRTVWRGKGISQCFLITNHHSYNDPETIPQQKRYAVKSNQDSSTVRVTYGKQIKQTLSYIQNMVKFFKTSYGVVFSEIMADFIKDQSNTWWMVNVKGFQVQSFRKVAKVIPSLLTTPMQNIYSDQNQKQTKYQKTKICKYCQKPYLQSQLKYKMTLKMIILTDRYLLHRGKTFKWLQRSDINNIELHSIYEEHRVCQRCYKLYICTKQLMDIEIKYAQKMGICMTEQMKYNMVMNVGSKYLEEESKSREVCKLEDSLPQQLQLGPYSKLIIQDNCPIKNDQMINQMIRYRFIINLVSIDELAKVDPSLHYFLEYSLINIKVRYKLDISPNDSLISLNKLRVIYAFCHDRKTLNQFIAQQESLTISLVCQTQSKQRFVWGKMQLPLQQFISDKIIKREYYKMFNLKDVAWGWGLTANIGVSSSNGYVDTSRNIFKKYKDLVYYPQNQQYFACEPLHSEWISMLREQKIGKKQKHEPNKESYDVFQFQQNQVSDLKDNASQMNMPDIEKQIKSYLKRGKKKTKNLRIF